MARAVHTSRASRRRRTSPRRRGPSRLPTPVARTLLWRSWIPRARCSCTPPTWAATPAMSSVRESRWTPRATPSAFQTTLRGQADACVTKVNPTGSTLVYSTYLGGNGDDGGGGIAVDSSGNAHVAGVTNSADFPTTLAAFQTASGGGISDVFVTKLNPTGAGLVYSTYLGGGGYDNSGAIVVDSAGNAYVSGVTMSTNFPTTLGAFQASFGGGTVDAFVTKLNPTGVALVYSTYLGGSGDDQGNGIAIDAAGNAYVTGETSSINFPTANPIQPTLAGSSDAFVTKVNPTGSGLVYSTYLGGSAQDLGVKI